MLSERQVIQLFLGVALSRHSPRKARASEDPGGMGFCLRGNAGTGVGLANLSIILYGVFTRIVLITEASVIATEHSLWRGIRRGLAGHCPNCGKGRLFSGFLKIRAHCDVCGADNSIYPSDDFPPYLTILLVGHLVVPLLFWVQRDFAPGTWLQAAIFLPLTVLLCLLLLPIMKGGTVGLCWATGLVRQA
jgi:uncharacterized protein (DUF983 family)